MVKSLTHCSSNETDVASYSVMKPLAAVLYDVKMEDFVSLFAADTAYSCDPRIKKFKEEEKARKESEKKAKADAKKREQEERERVRLILRLTFICFLLC